MNFSIHPDAEAEFLDAINYYEAHEPGLGLRFARETMATITRACQFSFASPRFAFWR